VAWLKLCAGEKQWRACDAGKNKRLSQSAQRRAEKADPSPARRLKNVGAPARMTIDLRKVVGRDKKNPAN